MFTEESPSVSSANSSPKWLREMPKIISAEMIFSIKKRFENLALQYRNRKNSGEFHNLLAELKTLEKL